MKIFAGIAAIIGTTAAGAGVALYKKGKSADFSGKGPFASLNDEIGSENFKDDPLYGTVIADRTTSFNTTVYKTVTPEFFEEELNKMTEWVPITMCGDRTFNSYIHSLEDTGASMNYYYINKSKLDSFANRITGDKLYNKFFITLGSKILGTNYGRYGDIITVSSEQSIGDKYDLHFVNIHGDWKFISYEQLMKDTNAAMHFDDGGTSSSHRLLHGVQIVALRDDTEEV
jgi:hypothetical protein